MNVMHAGFYVSTENAWVLFLFGIFILYAVVKG